VTLVIDYFYRKLTAKPQNKLGFHAFLTDMAFSAPLMNIHVNAVSWLEHLWWCAAILCNGLPLAILAVLPSAARTGAD